MTEASAALGRRISRNAEMTSTVLIAHFSISGEPKTIKPFLSVIRNEFSLYATHAGRRL